jgi:hypothetical protein
MALRLKYAGVPADRLIVREELAQALETAVADDDATGRALYALPTYTAMLELRELLVERYGARDSFA